MSNPDLYGFLVTAQRTKRAVTLWLVGREVHGIPEGLTDHSVFLAQADGADLSSGSAVRVNLGRVEAWR